MPSLVATDGPRWFRLVAVGVRLAALLVVVALAVVADVTWWVRLLLGVIAGLYLLRLVLAVAALRKRPPRKD